MSELVRGDNRRMALSRLLLRVIVHVVVEEPCYVVKNSLGRLVRKSGEHNAFSQKHPDIPE